MNEQAISRTYFSFGKLLISGEYVVLHGAKALAVPLKYGQQMQVTSCKENEPHIHFHTLEKGKTWFKAIYRNSNIDIVKSTDYEKAKWMQNVLKNLAKNKPGFFNDLTYKIKCDIDFKVNWGWGSSSSIISNLSYLADIDPFDLFIAVSDGSGYDVACTRSFMPIIYQKINDKRESKPVYFNPDFRQHIYFIYLERKQNSAKSIRKYGKNTKYDKSAVDKISEITERMAVENDIDEFKFLMYDHENIISGLLNQKRIKDKQFSDFKGEIKSLGAWGGDFAMAVSDMKYDYIKRYFNRRGIQTIFNFNEIIKC